MIPGSLGTLPARKGLVKSLSPLGRVSMRRRNGENKLRVIIKMAS